MPVAAIAMGVVALLLLVATRYGWHRDELYFLACGPPWPGATSTNRHSSPSWRGRPTCSRPATSSCCACCRRWPPPSRSPPGRSSPVSSGVGGPAASPAPVSWPPAASCSGSATCSRPPCSTSPRGWCCSRSDAGCCARPTPGGGFRSVAGPGWHCSTRTSSCCCAPAWPSAWSSSGDGACSPLPEDRQGPQRQGHPQRGGGRADHGVPRASPAMARDVAGDALPRLTSPPSGVHRELATELRALGRIS